MPDVESPRRLTRDLLRAFELAVMLTHSRASETIEVADLLGAMYIDNWDHIKRFWPDPQEAEASKDAAVRLELAKQEAERFANANAEKGREAEGSEAERARVWARLKEAWQRRYGLVEAG